MISVFRRVGVVVATMTMSIAIAFAGPAEAAAKLHAIVLPGASSAEGIAAGRGTTFYAGDLFGGDIFKGDVSSGKAQLLIDAPAGRNAVGMKFDKRSGLLYVAGGANGGAYVYDTSARTTVKTYLFAPPNSFINDVALTRSGAWFTDSVRPQLYFVPIDHKGKPGDFRTLLLSGPAADTSGDFNLNGIAASCDGKTLIVGHTGNGGLFTVNPTTGTSSAISGITLPGNDGLVLKGKRLWVVQGFENQVTRVKLSHDLSSGTVDKVITSPLFQVPSTAALIGHQLAVVNAKFDTGIPPTADQYEAVLVDR